MDSARGLTALSLACMLGRLEQVNILLDCPSVLVDTRDASGLTPLMRTPLFNVMQDTALISSSTSVFQMQYMDLTLKSFLPS